MGAWSHASAIGTGGSKSTICSCIVLPARVILVLGLVECPECDVRGFLGILLISAVVISVGAGWAGFVWAVCKGQVPVARCVEVQMFWGGILSRG